MSPVETTEPIDMSFGFWTQAGRRTMYLMEVQIPQCKAAISSGIGMAKIKVQGPSAVSCAKTAEPIKMSFQVWTRVGPRKHVLDGVHVVATWRIRLNHVRAAAFLSNDCDYLFGFYRTGQFLQLWSLWRFVRFRRRLRVLAVRT